MIIENIYQLNQPGAIFSIVAVIAGFYLYFYPAHVKWIGNIAIKSKNRETVLLKQFMFRKTWGFVSMGILPALAYVLIFNESVPAFGLTMSKLANYAPWIFLTLLIPALLNAFLARNPKTHKVYPQLRIREWTPGLFALSALGWFLYLLGYEYLFRGILLFGIFDTWGYWPAIAINTVIYSLAHFNKGPGETLGAIPFGILLCIITLSSGTIWFALIAHLGLALSNDFFSILYNPEMKFIKRKERP